MVYRDIAERLGRNVSIVHDCWQQRSREGPASRRPGSGLPCGTTERGDRLFRRMAVTHRTASAAETRAAVGATVTQRSATNRLLQGQLRARRRVACIPLTPNHCRLRRERCQARAHWRMEWRSVVFSDESRFCLGASAVRRRPGERLQPTCLRHRHTGPTPRVMVWGAISYDSRSTLVVIPRTLTANLYVSLVIQPVVLPFMKSIQGGVFQQDNARFHTDVLAQLALQSVDMLPWPVRSPDLSPIELVWDIIGRQLQRHPTSINRPCTCQPSATGMEQAGHKLTSGTCTTQYMHVCIQNSGGYTGY
ncbi:hypothetical protein AVEN_107286-1 [Araneus ventricosus]|uniref:Tc1-like transposase DDE domain-containing protein n=1 Tax=Araneus ventricosus TaxID=182803 RepID=A0A4Y2DUW3_ARAVE|nr:hypothetical protein AVEN_107286-1 [Araneus ventricosus]